ncbi:fasciclin domain-containing protein [Rasiella sp. SM2506]|uniref:fasciclin domain-containing protein n=1 Tax=Rasiella sp. SM2506 TaxID=3423914 RepID=UPI003D7A10DE
MKFRTLFLVCVLVAFTASAQKYTNTNTQITTKEWKGLTYSSEKSLFQNIENTTEFSKVAPLFKTGVIADDAMLTAFVMVNNSFSNLDEAKEKSLFADSWKPFITYHLIPGRVDSYSLVKAVANGKGTAYFNTILGQRLGVKEVAGKLVLFDGQGNTATIIAKDYVHKNGFFHIVDGLLLPSTVH